MEEKHPPMKSKKIKGVEITEYELASIRMICDYLFLDRFNDVASLIRFEKCFGPLFSQKNKDFNLVEAYKEIIGEKKKYITFRRMIKAFLKWKSKESKNKSFNFFMETVFKTMIQSKEQVIGKLVDGQLRYSTRNCRNRKIITKVSVLTDETKNMIKGMILEYDGNFNAFLCKQNKKEDIKLEINFALHQIDQVKKEFEKDRDGISHIAGKYSETNGVIKFLIFKCRSGKTLYIGDVKEDEGEKIIPFIFGSSRCQLKSLRIELKKTQLSYMEPKFMESERYNINLDKRFDDIDEKYLDEDQSIFEEKEVDKISDAELKNDKVFLKPLITDDAFVDKLALLEEIKGKDFEEVYTSFFVTEKKSSIEKFKDGISKVLESIVEEKKKRELLVQERQNINVKDSLYRKDDFDSLLVKIVKKVKKNANDPNTDNKGENEEEEEDEWKESEDIKKEDNQQKTLETVIKP